MKRNFSNQKELVRYRMRRAHTTLKDAQNLFSQDGSPASVVNRAYYSMFYAALALLATVGQQTSKHQGVLALFNQYFIKTKALPNEMGKFLNKAFDLRQIGDYEEEAELTIQDAKETLEFAEKFIKATQEKLLQDQ